MKFYPLIVSACVIFLAHYSVADNSNEKANGEKMELGKETNALSMSQQTNTNNALKAEGVTELSGAKRGNSRTLQNDANNGLIVESKDKTAENSHASSSSQPSTLELFEKYLEKNGAEMNRNGALTFEDLVKHLEKDELMLMTKAYEVLASGHENLVKKMKENGFHKTTSTISTTTVITPVYQSRSLRYRPKYKKLSSKQQVKEDPTLFFINNGRIYSIKRHS